MHVRTLVVAAMVAGALCTGWAAVGAESETALRVWNIDLAAVEPREQPSSIPALEPVAIVGARNGSFSGKLMVSGQLHGLTASASDLKGQAGTIGADRIRVRYGAEWQDMPGWYKPYGLDVLLEAPRENQSIVCVWMTVAVPKDAAAGTYRGTLAMRAAGSAPVTVPVELDVADWTLPEPEDFHTYIEMIQSPDTLAVEYGVPLWSERHWALIARTFDLMRPLANRVVYVPLICHTNFGNEQSMVRWIKKGENAYDYDFSILEKYLDLAEEHMGKPEIVVINAWDVYLKPAENKWDEEWWSTLSEDQKKNSYFRDLKERGDLRRKLQAEHGTGPAVTVQNGETLETVHLPNYASPAAEAQWKPLFDQLRERLEARGLAEAMTLGMLTDQWPSREEVEFLQKVSGDLPWVSHAHWSAASRRGGKVYDLANIAYETCVWDIEATDPDAERTYGWQREKLVLAHYRMRGMNGFYPSRMRAVSELNITGMQRGLGRIGADFWWALRDKRGTRRGTVTDRYPQSLWRNLDVKSCILAPGPEGAVPTTRYEHFREGLQECEARIAIEKAIMADEARLGPDLVGRCRELLKERQHAAWREAVKDEEFLSANGFADMVWYRQDEVCYQWFLNSNWQERTERLYALAGEVARAMDADLAATR